MGTWLGVVAGFVGECGAVPAVLWWVFWRGRLGARETRVKLAEL